MAFPFCAVFESSYRCISTMREDFTQSECELPDAARIFRLQHYKGKHIIFIATTLSIKFVI